MWNIEKVRIGVLVLVVLYILYSLASWNTETNEDALYGFWIAEGDEFCAASDIDSMMIFIGDAEPAGALQMQRTRAGYIIISDNICQQGFTLTYRPSWSGPTLNKYNISAKVEFDDKQIWEDRVNITIDALSGEMLITGSTDSDLIYARLTKHNEITNGIAGLAAAEIVESIENA